MAPPLPRPRALLLDAMGTLIGLQEPVGHTYARLAGEHGMAVTAAAVEPAFAQAYRSAPPLAFPGLRGEALRAAELDWWSARVHSCLLAATGTAPPPALAADLFAHYAQAAAWRVYPDVEPQLRRWRQRGLALAVVSNFDSRLPPLLKALGLADWLDAVVVSSEAGAAKPQPQLFQLALDQLGVSAAEAWHVGDSSEDVVGAAAAGVACLLVRRP